MGYVTRLCGSIAMSRAAFERMMALDRLGWTFQDETIADYLRGDFEFDEAAERFRFDSCHKMYHHREFFDILAQVKDRDPVDQVEQHGETYDAWFESGRFFVRRGAWAYVGEGPMVEVGTSPVRIPVVGPSQARLEHVDEKSWNRPAPRARAVTIDDVWLAVAWLDGEESRTGYWWFDVLTDIWDTADVGRLRLVEAGSSIAWLHEDGREAFQIPAEDVWRFREPA